MSINKSLDNNIFINNLTILLLFYTEQLITNLVYPPFKQIVVTFTQVHKNTQIVMAWHERHGTRNQLTIMVQVNLNFM